MPEKSSPAVELATNGQWVDLLTFLASQAIVVESGRQLVIENYSTSEIEVAFGDIAPVSNAGVTKLYQEDIFITPYNATNTYVRTTSAPALIAVGYSS